MFTEKTDICNFADDNILYKYSQNLSVVLNYLEDEVSIVLNWFKVNLIQANNPNSQGSQVKSLQ